MVRRLARRTFARGGAISSSQFKLSVVLYGLAARASYFRQRRSYKFIDNVAALMALIRGRCRSPDLERLAHLIHVALFALQASVLSEYVPFKSNWVDAVIRVGFRDS